MIVLKKDVGEPIALEDFFDSSNTSAKIYERSLEEVEVKPGDLRECVRVKGLEEPVGVSFWVLIDPESGKMLDFNTR